MKNEEKVLEIFSDIHKEIGGAIDSNLRVRKSQIAKIAKNDYILGVIDGKLNALRGIDEYISEKEKWYKYLIGKGDKCKHRCATMEGAMCLNNHGDCYGNCFYDITTVFVCPFFEKQTDNNGE